MQVIAPAPTDELRAIELEYSALREEIMRRADSRQQILSVGITIAGAFLGVGWGTGAAVALLLLPVILACLSATWTQNEVQIFTMQAYIRERIAPRLPGMGWESFARERRQRGLFSLPLDIISIGGVFLITQALGVILGLFRFDPRSTVEWVLLALALASVIAVVLMINYLVTHARK